MQRELLQPFTEAVTGGHDESGLSFAYRSLRANGLSFRETRQWLTVRRWPLMHAKEVSAVAWITGTDRSWLLHRTIVSLDSRRPYGFLGQGFCEGTPDLLHAARICPMCLKRLQYAKAAWLLRPVCGCPEHDSTLVERCPYCLRLISWHRPAIDVCVCGRFLTAVSGVVKLRGSVANWIRWVDMRLADASAIIPAADFRLPTVLDTLTIDGAYRLILAVGLLACPNDPPSRAMTLARTSSGMSEVIDRGLERLSSLDAEVGEIFALAPVIHVPALERMRANSACAGDANCAALLLERLRRGSNPTSEKRGRYIRGQLSLFP